MTKCWGFVGIAALLGVTGATAQDNDGGRSEMRAWHILCVNARAVVVVNVPLAYGVTIDPSGTFISYRSGWLSPDVHTVIKGADTTCDISPNR